ncbi:ABC transporter substrate-binding protein [Haloterrigena sp. SYSU A558-1]|uniref:ABC transporter substrate-binding protein n=1 Tax=Haloterrigena gelatinilytica TaxID=2741724 RepID=A0A8J8GSA8_9EURY|nr:ABC transporter substrate-binding protein [Haloterrigena gelatinilytica]NUB93062.1 ABC transporter substrate-binding protein [Haloterrigena gelatinilytica]NUC71028.1 ABC transporter substrate-binding protein [Haloterrigena gelatinilytica]
MVGRRQLLAGGTGLIATALAGCTGGGGDDESDSSAEDVEPYTVEIAPHGEFTFEEVPQTYSVIPSVYLDIGMALGKQPVAATDMARAPRKMYDILPDVTFNEDEIDALATGSESGYDKENFYAANPDVNLIDPRGLGRFTDWDDSDIQEIEDATGPFLASGIRFGPTHPFGNEQDTYYELYDVFEKIATVFQRQERYQEWASLHEEFMSNIESELPPEDERPSVVALWRGVDPTSGQFFPSPLHQYHNQTKPLYRLGLEDGYDAEIPSGGSVGYEELLEHDPDYICVVGSLTSDTHEDFVDQIVEPFENDANGQELTAVQEGNVIRSGGQYMGPIVDLFATEAIAKQVWPDRFGEWPGPVRDVPEDEQLFDRQEVSDIINGNF